MMCQTSESTEMPAPLLMCAIVPIFLKLKSSVSWKSSCLIIS
ncbi:hypothetical protein RLOC_00004790 [Lonchura striata]|uniref:Uncharacterized protein n=1 Tax=Lonchura striata TaxID=40157 RepID=A0A218UFD3_9PASE|nr:hypothetical protein RLOC_00004790 [Lonchura striata domestica]